MKFIGVRDLRNKSAKIWEQLSKEKELVITSNGKPIAILSSVSEENLEDNLRAFRQARAIDAVTNLQKRSIESGIDRLTLDEINAEIRAEREKRPK